MFFAEVLRFFSKKRVRKYILNCDKLHLNPIDFVLKFSG